MLALGGLVVDHIESLKKIVSPRLSAPSAGPLLVRVPACSLLCCGAACALCWLVPGKVKLLISRS